MAENQYGVWISPPIAHADDLTLRQKVLWGRIEALSRQEGYCWASTKQLAESSIFDVSERTLQRDLKVLEDRGYIRRTFLDDPDTGEVQERRIWPLRADSLQDDTHVTGGGDTDDITPTTSVSPGGTRSTTGTEKGVSPDEGEDDSTDPPPADESKRSIREQLGLDFSDEE